MNQPAAVRPLPTRQPPQHALRAPPRKPLRIEAAAVPVVPHAMKDQPRLRQSLHLAWFHHVKQYGLDPSLLQLPRLHLTACRPRDLKPRSRSDKPPLAGPGSRTQQSAHQPSCSPPRSLIVQSPHLLLRHRAPRVQISLQQQQSRHPVPQLLPLARSSTPARASSSSAITVV